MRMRASQPAFISTVVLLALAFPLALSARYAAKPGFNLFSRDQDVELGKQAEADVDKKMPLIKDKRIEDYVQRLGQRLAAKAPGYQYPYSFKVVNQKEINAFALPGGPVYVNLGTIQAADNEAELAGVMAHEISHIVMRHATNQASKQVAAQMPLALLGNMLGNGVGGQLARLGISFGVGSVFLKYSRDAEQQADLVGTDIMYDAGYNPQAMADFFAKLEEEGGARGPQFMSDHPNPGNRAAEVSREVRTLPRKSYLQDSAEFRAVKQIVAGMKPPSASEIEKQQQPQQSGAVQSGGNVMPSGRFQTLSEHGFSISYPDNWKVLGQGTSAVTIAPPDGISGDAIAYGVVLSEFQPQGDVSLRDAVQQLTEQVLRSNPDFRQAGSPQDERVNGRNAVAVALSGKSPLQSSNWPEPERDLLVAVQRDDGSLFYTVFVAPEKDFSRLQPSFQQMLKSLRLR
jgi:predicted Zn-dependent protease